MVRLWADDGPRHEIRQVGQVRLLRVLGEKGDLEAVGGHFSQLGRRKSVDAVKRIVFLAQTVSEEERVVGVDRHGDSRVEELPERVLRERRHSRNAKLHVAERTDIKGDAVID